MKMRIVTPASHEVNQDTDDKEFEVPENKNFDSPDPVMNITTNYQTIEFAQNTGFEASNVKRSTAYQNNHESNTLNPMNVTGNMKQFESREFESENVS